MCPLGTNQPPHCFEGYVNETVAVSWHNINYPIKIEWVINCPSLAVLITLTEKGHSKRKERKKRRDEAVPNKDEGGGAQALQVSTCVCVSFKGEEGAVLEGDSWFSLGPPEAWSSEKSRLIGEQRDRRSTGGGGGGCLS